MAMRQRLIMLLVSGAMLVFAGSASAAFPNFSDCPRENPEVSTCIDIQSVTGSLEIKGFTVPLGESLEIRGGLTENAPVRFIPPAGTNGFFARTIRIPGGILGLELPIPGNTVLGTAQLAGPASSIAVTIGAVASLSVPVKLKLDNPILGSSCYIGSNSNPVRLNLTTGTTSPPPPNRPISGSLGEIRIAEGGEVLEFIGQRDVDNAFAVPGASGCGFLGIANPIVNLKLGLPSAAGNNAMIVDGNVGVRAA